MPVLNLPMPSTDLERASLPSSATQASGESLPSTISTYLFGSEMPSTILIPVRQDQIIRHVDSNAVFHDPNRIVPPSPIQIDTSGAQNDPNGPLDLIYDPVDNVNAWLNNLGPLVDVSDVEED